MRCNLCKQKIRISADFFIFIWYFIDLENSYHEPEKALTLRRIPSLSAIA